VALSLLFYYTGWEEIKAAIRKEVGPIRLSMHARAATRSPPESTVRPMKPIKPHTLDT
ncbi:hypothetical protein AMTR_s04834p00002510, partial [Amborella trichopoda]